MFTLKYGWPCKQTLRCLDASANGCAQGADALVNAASHYHPAVGQRVWGHLQAECVRVSKRRGQAARECLQWAVDTFSINSLHLVSKYLSSKGTTNNRTFPWDATFLSNCVHVYLD